MPKFEKQNLKKIDPRWFLNETVEKTKLEQLEEVLTEQTLKKGMRERDPNGPIHKLQTYLKNKRLYRGEVDGNYGGGTQRAVRALQRQLIKAKKLPPRQKNGRSSADGVAGAATLGAIGSELGAVSLPAVSTPVGSSQRRTRGGATSTARDPRAAKRRDFTSSKNRYVRLLIKNLSGYVTKEKMDMVVIVLKRADEKGILSQVVQSYRVKTGDGLQDTIRGVYGVHEPKNQALAILGGKAAKKDFATTVSSSWESLSQALSKAVSFSKLLRIPLHLRAMTMFIMLRRSPMTERFLTNKDKQLMTQFLTYLQTVGGKKYTDSKGRTARAAFRPGAKKFATHYNDYGKFMRAQGNFENVHSHLDKKSLSALTRIMKKVWPKNAVNHLQLTIGRATVIDEGNHYLVIDNYDFNKLKDMPDEYKSWDNLPSSVVKNIKIAKGGDLTGGVENILSWYHRAGYPGYKVRWKIPKATAAAKVPGTRIDRKGRRRKA